MAITPVQLHQLYLAYFGRPADLDGFNFYTVNPGATLQSVAAAFSASPESQALYGKDFGAQQINAIYLNLFGREAEPAGLSYWLGEIASGRISPAMAAWSILVGAQGPDVATVANKMAVVQAFYGELDTVAELIGYAGPDSIAYSRAYLQRVLGTAGSLEAAMDDLEYEVALACGLLPPEDELPDLPPVPEGATPFTPGEDHLVGEDPGDGTEGDDVFVAIRAGTGGTLQDGDTLDGKGGNDTLYLQFGPATQNHLPAGAVAIENVETIHISNVSGNSQQVDAADFAGAEIFNTYRSAFDLKVAGLTAGQAVGVIAGNGASGANITFEYVDGVEDAELVLDDADGERVRIAGTDLRSLSVRSLETNSLGNRLAQLDAGGSAQVSFAMLEVPLDIAALNVADGARIEVTGGEVHAGFLRISAVEGELASLDASGFAGYVVFNDAKSTVLASDFVFKGGADDDRFYTGGVIDAGSIDAGAGDADVLHVTANGHIASAAAGAKYMNFERLVLHSGVSFDMARLDGIEAVSLVDVAAGTSLVGLTASQADGIVISAAAVGNGSLTLGMQEGVTTARLVVAGDSSPASLGHLDAGTVSALELRADTDMSVAGLAAMTSLDRLTVSGSGAIDITTGALDWADGAGTVDFSTATGSVRLDASGSLSSVLVTGATTAVNEIVDSGFDDVIAGGNLSDRVTYGGGIDELRLGGGGDVYDFGGRPSDPVADPEAGNVFYLSQAHSYGRSNAATAQAAFDPLTTDAVIGIVNDEAFDGTGRGTQVHFRATGELNNQVDDVAFGTTLVFGETEASSINGVFVLDAHDLGEANTAYLFIDSNATGRVESTDLMVKLIGAERFSAAEFSMLDEAVLTFTSAGD